MQFPYAPYAVEAWGLNWLLMFHFWPSNSSDKISSSFLDSFGITKDFFVSHKSTPNIIYITHCVFVVFKITKKEYCKANNIGG